MNCKEFSLAVKKEYTAKHGERFFTEKALLSALLEKGGFHRDAPLISPSQEISPKTQKELFLDLERLLFGYPIQYYLGTEFFCGEEFFVSEKVLIPRPETELLVDLGYERAEKNSVIFDLCCGSGCVGLSVMRKRPDLSVRFYDVSPEAVRLTEKNRRKFSLESRSEVLLMDLFSDEILSDICRFRPSLLASNPPYLSRTEMDEIPENVRWEPPLALFGGEDGLSFYRRLMELSERTDTPILCEMGFLQKNAVGSLLCRKGFWHCFYRDKEGRDRAFFARPKK